MTKKRIAELVRWLRPWRSVHYVGATVFGIIIGQRIIGGDLDFSRSILAVVSVFFSFQGMIVLNNLVDKSIDEISGKRTPIVDRALSEKDYRTWGMVFSALGGFAALLVSYGAFLIVVAAHIASFLYSAPPFRLKRFFPINTFLISLSTYMAMMFGYSLWGFTKTFISFPAKLTLLFLMVFTLSMSFKDRLDQEGDRSGGVYTLFTLFGERTGSLLNGIMMSVAYCSVPVILGYLPLYSVALPAAILSFIFCIRKPFREEPIFVVYFLFADVFVYVIWKNVSLLMPEI